MISELQALQKKKSIYDQKVIFIVECDQHGGGKKAGRSDILCDWIVTKIRPSMFGRKKVNILKKRQVGRLKK